MLVPHSTVKLELQEECCIFHCQDFSHDGAQGRGTAFGAGERNVAGDKHSWHVTIGPIYLVL